MIKQILNKIHTGILLILAAGTPVLAVLDEKFWFEKRVALAGAAIVLLALLATKMWVHPPKFCEAKLWRVNDIGWAVFGGAMVVAGLVPAGRISNLMAPELWVGVGAVLAYFAIKSTTPLEPTAASGGLPLTGQATSGKIIKWGVFAAAAGMVAAGMVIGVGRGREMWGIGGIGEQGKTTLEILGRSPVWGEFREFRVARLGVLQVANGLGILGVLGTLVLVYQLGLKSVKGIIKSGSIWGKLLNILVLVLLVGFLVLPHPAVTLFPLAIIAALGCGISPAKEGSKGDKGLKGMVGKIAWAGFVGLLVVVILGSSFGLGRVVWGELKFREALAAANRNEGITTYYALLESIKRNPYEVRYRLLASQIDIALANSIATAAAQEPSSDPDDELELGSESTPSAGLTPQDQNNILILIQQAVVEGKAAIKLDPENSLLWQNLASIYRSLIGIAGGAEDWALKCYQRAAELNPRDPNPQLFIGEIHFLAGNFQGAAEAFKEAVRIDSDFARAHYDLAIAYNAFNEIDQAIGELERVLEILPADDPSREQVEKDLEFLEAGSSKVEAGEEAGNLTLEEETTETEELKEATTSAEVQPPPPPVGPEEATESAEPEEVELEE